MIGIIAGPAAVIYLINGDVDPGKASAIILGSFLGSRIGTAVSHRMTAVALRLLFVVIMIYTAYKMFARGLL